MKKTIALLALLPAVLATVAQKPVYRLPFETEPKKMPDVLVMPHASGTQTAFLLKNSKKIEYVLLGADLKPVAQFTHSETPDKTIYTTVAVPAGYIFNGKKVYNFIYDEKSNGGRTAPGRDVFLMDVIDFGSNKSELTAKHNLADGEKTVNAFAWNNTFYIISIPAGGNAVSVCYIDSTLNKTVRTYPLSVGDIYKGYSTLENLFKHSAVVYPDRENDLEAVTAPVKIMPQPGKVIIAVEQKENGTSLVVVDLANNKMEVKQPEMSECCFHSEKNSTVAGTVLGSQFFVASACKQKLELAVYDYTNGKLLKKYESAKDDGAPAIALGGINGETFAMGRKKGEKSFDNTGAFLKALLSGNAGVRVQPVAAGQYVVTVAALKYSDETPALPFPGVIRPETPAAGYVPEFYAINYGQAVKLNNSYTTAWFRTALNAPGFEKIKLNLKPGPADKLRELVSLEEKLPAFIPLFTMGGSTYYPWYDAEAQQFTLRVLK